MSASYRIILMGRTDDGLPKSILEAIEAVGKDFGLKIGDEIEIVTGADFLPEPVLASVGFFIGSDPAPAFKEHWALNSGIPIIPLVSSLKKCHRELPGAVGHLNAMEITAQRRWSSFIHRSPSGEAGIELKGPSDRPAGMPMEAV